MANKTNTSPQHSSKHGCCDSEASKDKAAPAVTTNPKAVPAASTAKPSAAVKTDDHGCHEKTT